MHFFSFFAFSSVAWIQSSAPNIKKGSLFTILLSWVLQSDYVRLIRGKFPYVLCYSIYCDHDEILEARWSMKKRFLLTPGPWEVRSTCCTWRCLFISRTPMLFKTLHSKRQPCILFFPLLLKSHPYLIRWAPPSSPSNRDQTTACEPLGEARTQTRILWCPSTCLSWQILPGTLFRESLGLQWWAGTVLTPPQ